MAYPRFFFRQAFNPSSKLEEQLYNAVDLRTLYTFVIENNKFGKAASLYSEDGSGSGAETLKWKHTYFFFRGLRHI